MQRVRRGADKRVGEIYLGVGRVEADGLLCAGEDNGLFSALYQIRQRRRRIGHGVGAVADDKAVVAVVALAQLVCKPKPVVRAEIGTVEAEQLQAVDLAE